MPAEIYLPASDFLVHAIIHTITLNTSGTARKCIEGREFIIALPESFVEYKADDVVRLFTDSFYRGSKLDA